jgi:hypothetical protein
VTTTNQQLNAPDSGESEPKTTVFVSITKKSTPSNIVRILANHNLRSENAQGFTGKGSIQRLSHDEARQAFVQGFAEKGLAQGFVIRPWGIELAGPSDPAVVGALAKDSMTANGIVKLRKDAIRAIEIIVSWPLTHWEKPDDVIEACVLAMKWAARFGVMLSATIHTDEGVPHCHFVILPLIEGHMVGSDAVGGPRSLKTHCDALETTWHGLNLIPLALKDDDPLTVLALKSGAGRDTSDEALQRVKPFVKPLPDCPTNERTLSCGGSGDSSARSHAEASELGTPHDLSRQVLESLEGLKDMIRRQATEIATLTAVVHGANFKGPPSQLANTKIERPSPSRALGLEQPTSSVSETPPTSVPALASVATPKDTATSEPGTGPLPVVPTLPAWAAELLTGDPAAWPGSVLDKTGQGPLAVVPFGQVVAELRELARPGDEKVIWSLLDRFYRPTVAKATGRIQQAESVQRNAAWRKRIKQAPAHLQPELERKRVEESSRNKAAGGLTARLIKGLKRRSVIVGELPAPSHARIAPQ